MRKPCLQVYLDATAGSNGQLSGFSLQPLALRAVIYVSGKAIIESEQKTQPSFRQEKAES
ncbi:MAG: hypothetical protein ABSE53_15765 [Terracidiphilus sp.]|jgi:hypothetical protein